MSGAGTGTPAVPGNIPTTVATRGGVPFLLERVTQPEIEPITLAEMKIHLGEFSSVTAKDADITALITAAREWVEDFTGRALIDQTWRLTLAASATPFTGYTDSNTVTGIYYPANRGEILLRKSPLLGVTSFVRADSAGVETVYEQTEYAVCEPDSKWPRIAMLGGATVGGEAMRIEFRAGFANRLGSPAEGAEMVPKRFIQAMKLYAEAVYNRDEKMMKQLLEVAERLITPERTELGLA